MRKIAIGTGIGLVAAASGAQALPLSVAVEPAGVSPAGKVSLGEPAPGSAGILIGLNKAGQKADTQGVLIGLNKSDQQVKGESGLKIKSDGGLKVQPGIKGDAGVKLQPGVKLDPQTGQPLKAYGGM